MTILVALLVLAAAPLDAGTPLPSRLPVGTTRAAAADGGLLPLSMPPLPFAWELPPNAMHEVPIDGTTYVRGVPVRMRYVMVKGTQREIGGHFLESFTRQGLFIEPGQNVEQMLTGVDPESIVTYTVVLQANSPGYTTVILGEAKPLEKKPLSAGGLPVPPSAKDFVPVQFEGYTVLSFSIPDPLKDVRSFYAVELPRRGYQPTADGSWEKPGERLEVTITADEGKKTRVVLKQQR